MDTIAVLQRQFDQYLQENPIDGNQPSLYEPANYILSLGGKRLRPVFVMLGCEAYGTQATMALKAAMAIEVFHNFSLVHDDIMDKASLRRGMPTVHEKYDLNTAILSGDAMMIKAYQYLLEYDDPVLVKDLMATMNAMALGVCEGQQMDMDFESQRDVTISAYLDMITKKTSVLIGAAIQMGAIIAGADSKNQQHIYEFAKNFGIAFQLQDDVLDIFGEAAQVGKRIGGDILQNKKTYLFIKSLELSDENQRDLLEKLYFTTDHGYSDEAKIQAVTTVFKDVHVEVYSNELIEAYRDLALSHLAACDITDVWRDRLTGFVNDWIFRSK